MVRVMIYRFTIYDVMRDEVVQSRRWGTREGIEAICGAMLEDTETEVDASVIGKEIDGLTTRAFDPNPRIGIFQIGVKLPVRPLS